MKLPIPERFIDWLVVRAKRTPYFHIDGYMDRWWLFGFYNVSRNKDNPVKWIPLRKRSRLYHWITDRIAIRLHHILRSDADRHMHDHPAWNVSIVLRGGYYELMPTRPDGGDWHEGQEVEDFTSVWRGPGSVVFRRASSRHRLVIPYGMTCLSVFILGRKSQSWGFYTRAGKVGWREYLGIEAPK